MYIQIMLCSVTSARAEIDERAKPRALMNAAIDAVSTLKTDGLKPCRNEQLGRSKPAYPSPTMQIFLDRP